MLRTELMASMRALQEMYMRAIGGDVLALHELDATLQALNDAADSGDAQRLKDLLQALNRGMLN